MFRGQADASWNLIPSLYRINNINIINDTVESSYSSYEATAVSLFFDEALPYLPPIERNYANDRIVAQHFGVPTRLLDWTKDPLVALFFAVEYGPPDVDAALFLILPDGLLPLTAKALKGPHQCLSFVPPAFDRRIPAQKSVFTYHPFGPENEPFVPLDERPDMGNFITTATGLERGFIKIILSAKAKTGFRDILRSIGIDRRNLFPGLDGIGADVGARALTGHLMR